jgi:phosphoribosylformimino-5-aminoimidazole carboxamide ribotide isomerase
MKVWAAVDILEGKVVRLETGARDKVTIYGSEPKLAAQRWERMGFDGIHLVDLDSAMERGSNSAAVSEVLKTASIPIQVGGGIRNFEKAQELLSVGAKRLVIGTVALSGKLRTWLEKFTPERITVALDYSGGEVKVRGWTHALSLNVTDAVKLCVESGAEHLLLTAISKDGTLEGPDFDMLTKIRSTTGVELIASGGVRSYDDLLALKRLGMDGAVVGKALYEGHISAEDLRKLRRVLN